MNRIDVTNRTITAIARVNGAELYHEIRGSGPPILFIMGATGDGGVFRQVAEHLADAFTVVTYHRRANSLSPRPDGWTSTSIDEQADDAAALLRALGLAPAAVFGGSMGALVLLNMMQRHPDSLRGAIVHEAPLPPVLPNGAEIEAGLKAMIEDGLATVGPRGTMERFIRANTGDATFENIEPTLRERMLDNAEVFLFTELEAAVSYSYQLDAEALARCRVSSLVAAGIESRGNMYHASSAWVATQLGTPLQEIPGAHTPYLDHPDELASVIRTFAQGLD
jgi:pimeloyl-ACP methyl ester carboxylesterase